MRFAGQRAGISLNGSLASGLCLCVLALSLIPVLAAAATAATEAGPAIAADTLRLGERMYREGILPSGEPMKAFVTGDVPVDGKAFTCVSCHLRSGLGSIEGGVTTPPTNGRILYEERKPYITGQEFVPLIHNYAVYLPVRPAYTDETLAALISTGFDPTGRSVLNVMPRYELNDKDMAVLIAYLKTLSAEPSPGVSRTEMKFATVIVDGADPAAVEAMIAPLQFGVDRKNSLALANTKNRKIAKASYNMLGSLANMKFSLSRWTLKGDPSTWRSQLESYYKAEPVFALLGGITTGEWEPVHRFCEEHKIPDLMPVVDYPVISETDWYTLYPSRGVRQEGEAAARYLHTMHGLFKGRPIVQITRNGKRSQALAEGFRAVWAETGHDPVREIALSAEEKLTAETIRSVIAKEKPAVLVIWDDARLLNALSGIAENPDAPGLVMASGTCLGPDLWTIPEQLRSILYLTYPYRLPQDEAKFDPQIRKIIPGKKAASLDQRIVRQTFIANELLGKALVEMRGEFYRDFLLDTIGMFKDMYLPLYERVSFGPGQRYASKGCFIVQLGKGEKPRLERKSEWVMQ
ncbi:MAG: ABC transporter substrate-binding protein [Thermodesulfovibrionales bacterium]